jgi:hypothetical protein
MSSRKPLDPSLSGSRAHISHAAEHTRLRFGSRPAHMNPAFQVPDQNEPTTANPVPQHKQFKGHQAGHSGHVSIKPHFRGAR